MSRRVGGPSPSNGDLAMCPPGQLQAPWVAPDPGTEPALVPSKWPRVRVLGAQQWGRGHQAAWPRAKQGMRSEGGLPRPQVGIVWGRKESEDLGAPWVPGCSLGEAGLAPSPRPTSEAQSAEAAKGPGRQPSNSLPGLWSGVWGLKPEPGGPGPQPPSATVAHVGVGGQTERRWHPC